MTLHRRGAVLLAMLMAAAAGAAPPQAEDAASEITLQQALVIYKALPADNSALAERLQKEQADRLFRLRGGEFGKPEEFTTRARVTFTTDRRPAAAQTRELTPRPGGLAPPAGWTGDASMLTWRGDRGPPAPIPVPLAGQGGAGFSVGDFDEMWLDYTTVRGIPACTPQLDLNFSVRPLGHGAGSPWSLSARTGTAPLRKLRQVDPTRSIWAPKDLLYLAARELGLPYDENWRYAQHGGNGVAQRRWREPLDAIEAIDVAIAHRALPVQVNLMVSTSDDRSSGELIEIPGPGPNSRLEDGRVGMRINIREALERRFPAKWAENTKEAGKHRFTLKEIVLFLPGDSSKFAGMKPVHEVIFLGSDTQAAGHVGGPFQRTQSLPSTVRDFSAHRHRMVVNLRSVVDKGEVGLQKAVAWFTPPPGASWCMSGIEGVRLASVFEASVPAFATAGESWIAAWGNPVGGGLPRLGELRQPGIIAYLPFFAFTGAGDAPDRSREYTLNPEKGQLVFKPLSRPAAFPAYRVFTASGSEVGGEESRIVLSSGAALNVPQPAPKVAAENELLIVEGSSTPISIAWPLDARIDANTWLFFGMGEGADQVGMATLSLTLSDGRTIKQRIEPNQPLHVVTAPAVVRHAALEIVPNVTAYRFKLQNLVLFAPSVVSYAGGLAAPIPTLYHATPTPVVPEGAAGTLRAQPGKLVALAGDDTLRFTTPLQPALDWMRGIQLTYRLPLAFSDADGCQLNLELDWARGRIERKVCLTKRSDSVFIPFARLVGSAERLSELGPLRSIAWTLAPSRNSPRAVDNAIELSFVVEGMAMVSPLDNLRSSPLLYASDSPIAVEASRFDEAVAKQDSAGVWLPLPADSLSRILAAPVRAADHWVFRLDEIVAEPRRPMPAERWRALAESPPEIQPRRMPTWFIGAGIAIIPVLGLWAAWRKSWWSPRAAWAWCAAAWEFAAATWRPFSRRLWAAAGRCLPFVHMAIGLMAIVPGVLLAGWLGWTFPGVMMLVAAPMFAWAAYCHWRRVEWPGRSVSPHFRNLAWAVAVGCAVWSLGRYKASAEVVWGFLPLMALVYARLPVVWPRTPEQVARFRPYVASLAWLLLTVALYARASVADFGGARNHYYTAGAFAVALTLRAAIVALRPIFAGFAPSVHARVYGSAGSVYFAAALVMVFATLLLLGIKREVLAEHAATVLYLCLLFGTVKEILALVRRSRAAKAASAPSDVASPR